MDLKSLVVDTKSVWIPFSGIAGFEVEVASISRKELSKLRKRCTEMGFDRSTRLKKETLNEELFVKEFSKAVIKNWKGLTIEALESLVLIDGEGQDPNAEIPYSPENAEFLVNSSSEFDTWLNEVVFDLEKFRTGGTRGVVEPS